MKATDTVQESRRALWLIEYAWEEQLLEAKRTTYVAGFYEVGFHIN